MSSYKPKSEKPLNFDYRAGNKFKKNYRKTLDLKVDDNLVYKLIKELKLKLKNFKGKLSPLNFIKAKISLDQKKKDTIALIFNERLDYNATLLTINKFKEKSIFDKKFELADSLVLYTKKYVRQAFFKRFYTEFVLNSYNVTPEKNTVMKNFVLMFFLLIARMNVKNFIAFNNCTVKTLYNNLVQILKVKSYNKKRIIHKFQIKTNKILKLSLKYKKPCSFTHKKLYKNLLLTLKKNYTFLNYLFNKITTIKKVTQTFAKTNVFHMKFGIFKINIRFSSFSVVLTDFKGKIISWINSGSDKKNKAKRTRMTPMAITKIMKRFLIFLYKKRVFIRYRFKFIKIDFTGPSIRFRKRFRNIIRKNERRYKYNIICTKESFSKSYNGCRLTRRKR
jgi:hypothetical protein